MTGHSSIVGGSTAGRVIACPASVQAVLALPPSAETTSEYAEEGSFAHAVMQKIMEDRRDRAPWSWTNASVRWRDQFIYDRVVTQQHLDGMIDPALFALSDLEQAYGGSFEIIGIEQKVVFPGIIDAFGTIDLILASRSTVLHVDWKFGQGVPVLAVTSSGQINPQLMYYITASRYTQPSQYHRKLLVGAIIQPRSAEPLTHTVIRKADIINFRDLLQQSVRIALRPGPLRVKGEHCRFAPCKLTCPAWIGPLIDLSALKVNTAPAKKSNAYGEYLAHAKDLVDTAALFKKEIDDQMHAFLSEGGKVPGWRLKHKTRMRQWIDETEVEAALKKLGFKPSEIWRRKLLTFEAADALARRKNRKIPDDLRVAPATSETTIARDDDPAPIVQPVVLVEKFQASLKLLMKGPGQ